MQTSARSDLNHAPALGTYVGRRVNGWRFGMRPWLPISYRVRLGRRFDSPPEVDAFMAALDGYYRSELRGAPTWH